MPFRGGVRAFDALRCAYPSDYHRQHGRFEGVSKEKVMKELGTEVEALCRLLAGIIRRIIVHDPNTGIVEQGLDKKAA